MWQSWHPFKCVEDAKCASLQRNKMEKLGGDIIPSEFNEYNINIFLSNA